MLISNHKLAVSDNLRPTIYLQKKPSRLGENTFDQPLITDSTTLENYNKGISGLTYTQKRKGLILNRYTRYHSLQELQPREVITQNTLYVTKPFNIASYALLTMMIAQVCGLKVGDFVHTFGDAHLYLNHLEQVDTQLARDTFPLPKMKINPDINNLFDFTFDDFALVNYQSHPAIKAPIAV